MDIPNTPRQPAPRRPRSERRPLTTAMLRNLQPGLHQDAAVAGLYVRVLPTGGIGFVLRYMLDGSRHDLYIGSTSEVGLAEARELARGYRLQIKAGIDPLDRRKAERAANRRQAALVEWTFAKAATEVHATLLPGWKNEKHGAQWINTLSTYVFPLIGDKPVAEVDVAAVVSVLKPIWTTKPETARRVRQRLDAVLRWAVAHGYSSTNAVDAAVELLPKQRDLVEHHRALPAAALPAFMKSLRAGPGAPSRRALDFAVLTAARSGEVRGATWGEINLDAKVWTVPAARMKAARDHVVPLSDAAVAVLQAAGEGAADALVFPGPTGRPMSDAVFTALLDRMGVAATAHGFRSTFRDWCSETGVPRETAERALAHAVGNSTEAAYLRTTLLEQRRDVMERWAAYCASA